MTWIYYFNQNNIFFTGNVKMKVVVVLVWKRSRDCNKYECWSTTINSDQRGFSGIASVFNDERKLFAM